MTVKEMSAGLRLRPLPCEDEMTKVAEPQFIESTAGQVADELARQGISPDERVTLTIEPELIPGRRASRKLVIAAGLTDDDIDNLIKRAQQEVEPLLPR